MEEEINNKWLEMIEEDEKRDGISMLEQLCAENGFIKNWCWPLCWCVRVEESKKIIDFFAQIHNSLSNTHQDTQFQSWSRAVFWEFFNIISTSGTSFSFH